MSSKLKKSALRKSASQGLQLLGGISAAVFLRDFWQKKPLLIRNAITDFVGPLSMREILTLAGRDDAESRLITRRGNTWELQNGPFSRRALSQPDDVSWTVLVHDVQHFSFEAHDLLAKFDFMPRARIDDLMVSYAVRGAGVGPHFDSYDVFLLQGKGKRRWQISGQRDLRLRPDSPLKILSHFVPEDEYILETGDMLYLPPGIAHNGIAETACATWSIGFRAPSKQDLSVAFLDHVRDAIQLTGQYADAGLIVTTHPAQIDAEMQRRISRLLREVQNASRDVAAVRRFTGCYLTEPKSHVVFDTPHSTLAKGAFSKLAKRFGVELELKTRMLYDDQEVFLNGAARIPTPDLRIALRELADKRSLAGSAIARLEPKLGLAYLYECYREGVLAVARH